MIAGMLPVGILSWYFIFELSGILAMIALL
jgi:hypothetical protein